MRRQLPLILCPTHYESRTLRSALAARGVDAEFAVCGVGPGAVARWFACAHLAKPHASPPGRRVILAGLAGALDHTILAGTSRIISRVRGVGADQSRESASSYCPPLQGDFGVTLASLDRACCSVAEKSALALRTGAALVDLESASFASCATRAQWNWGIVRGVSDGADEPIEAWTSSLLLPCGSISIPALLRALASNPARIATLLLLSRSSSNALKHVASDIDALLRARHTAQPKPARTLILGGTFDPPHVRHAEIAREAARFLRCTRIIVIPCACNPLRQDHRGASASDRLEMARRAFASLPSAVIDPREINRAGLSYTVDTLAEISRELALSREDIILLIGSDAALQFDRWKEWREIDERLALIGVVLRGSAQETMTHRELSDALCAKFDALGSDGARWARAVLPLAAVDLSATAIRARIACGQPLDDLVHPAVADWIRQRGLYA